jgi:hypothetical protein
VLRHKETSMLRRFAAAGVVLFLAVGALIAADKLMAKGKIVEVNSGDKGTIITVKVDDKDTKFRVGKDTKIVDATDDKNPKEIKADDLKKDQEVTVSYEEVEKNGKKRKQVSEIKVTKK